jgi:hypothetical protein
MDLCRIIDLSGDLHGEVFANFTDSPVELIFVGNLNRQVLVDAGVQDNHISDLEIKHIVQAHLATS